MTPRRPENTLLAGMTALVVAAALLFAVTARAPVTAPATGGGIAAGAAEDTAAARGRTPRALFDSACAGCHDAADLRRRLRDAPDPDAAARRFVDFLASHGSTDAEADEAIVRWLREPPAPR